jgi:hypothetical protein
MFMEECGMCKYSLCLELSNLFCFQDYLCCKFEATGTSYSLPQMLQFHAITHGRVKITSLQYNIFYTSDEKAGALGAIYEKKG